MAGSPQHATLVAATVTTFTFDEDFRECEVLNVDGAAAVYFLYGTAMPTVEGTGCNVLPAAIGGLVLPTGFADGVATVIKCISEGTPKVSVRGIH